MDTVPFTFHSYGETGTIDAVQPAPGLFVYRLPEHLRNVYFPWTVGHSSGHAIAAFESEAHALGAVDLIADYTDWERTADELRADVDPYELRDFIEEKTTGVFISRAGARQTA
jgi:hypothetical protein